MKVCSIDGCNKRAIGRGWCQAHYARWKKHGNPTAGRTPEGAVLAWLVANQQFAGVECLTFPYARKRSGYGALKFRGSIIAASRAMCILAHGDPPGPNLVAAHSCGNGHLGCVNPSHLRWATAKENSQDHRDHIIAGLKAPTNRKIPIEAIPAIMAARGVELQEVTAARYGVTASAICRVQRGNRGAIAFRG